MLDRPQLGQFLLIELASAEEASLGRITKFVPSGLLATAEGEDYVNTMQRRQQIVPEDLKEARLKYRVQIKLLGAVKTRNGRVLYVPSQRRLPHLGARVALPSDLVLQELCRLGSGRTDLGDYVLGEFVYCGAGVVQSDEAMRSMDPKLGVTFDIQNLVSRRTVVFARAGYGKSNLMKFLLAELYRSTPKDAHGRPIGTLIFDADGEYFWPDVIAGRPGLCDVPHLANSIAVFTNRRSISPYYGSWKVGTVRLDLRDLPPRDVIGIALPEDKQTHQNVLKLKAMSQDNWRHLIDLIETQSLQASDAAVGGLLGYPPGAIAGAAAEIGAAKSNVYGVVRALHDPGSTLIAGALDGLVRGMIVVLDISLLSSAGGQMLAGLLLRKIFNHNQENFTGGEPILPVIAVLEEAQSYLGRSMSDASPFAEWVKEGRKYQLGAILITQQPGALAPELLSQADNWFCFHLLSEGDASTLGKYNSHYSSDVLAHLIGEPISGNCYMWSAPHQPFVLPVRVRDFGAMYGGGIKREVVAGHIETVANLIQADLDTENAGFVKALVEALRHGTVKYHRIPGSLIEGSPAVGVYKGQVFRIVEKIVEGTGKNAAAGVPKLLDMLFGEGRHEVLPGPKNRSYHCVPLGRWVEVLGVEPTVIDQ